MKPLLTSLLLVYRGSAFLVIDGFPPTARNSDGAACTHHRPVGQQNCLQDICFCGINQLKPWSSHICPYCTNRRKVLLAKNNDEDNHSNAQDKERNKCDQDAATPNGRQQRGKLDSPVDSMELFEQPGLLTADIFAIAIASQLMGLLDVLNDPDFWQNGGWFQSIPTVPTTLGTLVQRFSALTITWVICAFFRGGYTNEALESTTSDDTKEDKIPPSIRSSFNIWTSFCIIRLASGSVLAYVLTQSVMDANLVGEIARQCYVVGLTTFTARYLYARLLW